LAGLDIKIASAAGDVNLSDLEIILKYFGKKPIFQLSTKTGSQITALDNLL